MLFFDRLVLPWSIEVTDACHKVRIQLQKKVPDCSCWGGGGHLSALTGSDSVQRGPNYCLTWLIVVSEECIPTEVPGISLTALLKTYRPVLTSTCCYVHCWSKATSWSCNYIILKIGMVTSEADMLWCIYRDGHCDAVAGKNNEFIFCVCAKKQCVRVLLLLKMLSHP